MCEDHVQAYFAWLLDKGMLSKADQERGKFRAFLLTGLKNFVANEYDREQTQKRGGDHKPMSLDFAEAESHYNLRAPDWLTPDRAYDRTWALGVLDTIVERLRVEAEAGGNAKRFEAFRGYLTADESTTTYRETGSKLGMTDGAVKVAVHRLRKRYRRLLREEIAQTVAAEELVEEEIQELFNALAH